MISDKHIGMIYEGLRQRGLRRPTIVIGDHRVRKAYINRKGVTVPEQFVPLLYELSLHYLEGKKWTLKELRQMRTENGVGRPPKKRKQLLEAA